MLVVFVWNMKKIVICWVDNLIVVIDVSCDIMLEWLLFVLGIEYVGESIVKVLVVWFGDLVLICWLLWLLFKCVLDIGGEVV